MRSFVRAVNRLSKACGYLSAALIALSILIICEMVFQRYVLNLSTIWQTEFVIFTMVVATLIGTPYVQHLRGHVNVDLIPIYLKGRARFALDVGTKLAILVVVVPLTWYGGLLTFDALEGGWRTPSVWGPPLWPAYLALPVGFGLLGLQVIADLIALFLGEDKPFGIDDAAGSPPQPELFGATTGLKDE